MPKPDQNTAEIMKHHRAAGPTQLHWAGCDLGPLLCQGYQITWKFPSRSFARCRYGELLITRSKRLQTIISTVLNAGKSFTILGSATKTFQAVAMPLSAKRLQYFSPASANSFLLTFTQVSPNDTPGPCVTLHYTEAATCVKHIYIFCTCKYTCFAFVHVIQGSLS